MQRFTFGPPPFPHVDLPVPLRLVPQVRQTLGELYKAAYGLGAADGFAAGFAAGEAVGTLAGVLIGLAVSVAAVLIATGAILLFRRS